MKTGDRYVGKTSGLCLEVVDKTTSKYVLECERRVVDKKTGEVVVEKRRRSVHMADLPTVLLGYDKA